MMRPPELSKQMARIVVWATILLSSNNGWAQNDFTPYMDKIVSACLDKEKVKSIEDRMPLPIIQEYCRCYAQRLVDLSKTREVPAPNSPGYIPFAKEAAQPCIEAALKAIGR